MGYMGNGVGGRRGQAFFKKYTERKRVNETLIVEVASPFPAAVTGKQTGSWFALITGKWVRPEDDDHITPIACDVIGDVVRC